MNGVKIRRFEERTFEAAIDVADMSLSEGAQTLGKVNEWRALPGVEATEADDGDLCESAGVCLQDSIYEGSGSDADRCNLG